MCPLLVFLAARLAVSPCAAAPEVDDVIAARVAAQARPGWAAGPERGLARLLERPADSACNLIQGLHPVATRFISGYDASADRDALAVVWRIRALRFLTACRDFRGPTHLGVSHHDEAGRQFLERRGRMQLPFFAVWMSRDSIYLAPPDAQAAIIDQWKAWYAAKGSRFEYRACPRSDDWYF